MSRFNKLHIVSKIMVFCAVAMVLSSLLEVAAILKLIAGNDAASLGFNFSNITPIVSDIVYGLGFLGTVAIIEVLNKILAKLENGRE